MLLQELCEFGPECDEARGQIHEGRAGRLRVRRVRGGV
jgi:hypothetical protein